MAGILDKVKNALGITGNYQDDTLTVYVNEIKEYMLGAGVAEGVVDSDMSAGVIARGVTDLWNYNGGAGKLSEYFYQRVSQLVYAMQTGKIICFSAGDYGLTYPVNVSGVDISEGDKVVFTCGEFAKEYKEVTNNCVLIIFTQEETDKFTAGTYRWTLKLVKEMAVITVVNDGVLIVR